MSDDQTSILQERIREAAQTGEALVLRGAGTKDFLGRTPSGTPVTAENHRGIVGYEPKELVVTARAGTPLAELEATLAEQGQMLAFEPPHLGAGATLGGTIACGLSGPARATTGAARDFVLGVRLVNGRGQVLRFGGEVMKNVAGYDVPRLMAGAFGTLGLLLEVSLKVLPLPAATRTLAQECDAAQAIRLMSQWAGRPWPISATCHDGERLFVRLSGADQGVAGAAAHVGGEPLDESTARAFWAERLREQGHDFFASEVPTWRLSVPPAAPPLALPGKQLIEWGGAQRWLRSPADAETIRAAVAAAGGHATLFRGGDRSGAVFEPLPPALLALHRRLKEAFDPVGILNPGRLYPEL
ncbi:FAD/FMN-dependent dehydrogenase [Thioflavicoccus mobilis 8321]|uniref:FAD/FMN-dependent dehydrogenase n=1 Tax=Thioflavicoccus mobilis 8321 TaxID=765912 RepID=L0GZ78_9GAMM|nr:glycolate oxidase subunit GlcE [Thioflavicoccus mobilis]AGA90685.1 FAD/FMN-dependent dehydrogenase [Thioflavicoccus mobilis 8321]